MKLSTRLLTILGVLLALPGLLVAEPISSPQKQEQWVQDMLAARLQAQQGQSNADFPQDMWTSYPLETDWFLQDNQVHQGWKHKGFDARGDFAEYLQPNRDTTLELLLIETALAELGPAAASYRDEIPGSRRGSATGSPDDPAWLELYLKVCNHRRRLRLATLLEKTQSIVFAKHQNFGSVNGIYLITETEGCPGGGSELRQIDLLPEALGQFADSNLLFDAQGGIVRDPDISFDGQRLLFAWRKTNKDIRTQGRLAPSSGNYKIYEMDLATRALRQLTTDHTYGADFEPCYLSNGNIMFSSARIMQHITCGWGDCSNLFIMNGDGHYARRLGFDQTNTAFPVMLPDGRVIYTRRDYNDRGQTYAHALFVMNPDGTTQTEYYGNNTTEPTSFQHARPIPGTDKVMCILGGYHTSQGGKLAIIDPKEGDEDLEGVTCLGWDPSEKTRAGDQYGKEGDQYANPYPLDEDSFLVSYCPLGGYLFKSNGHIAHKDEHGLMRYKVYYMTVDGRREMLAADPELSCLQPVPVMPGPKPFVKSSFVNYQKTTGTFFVQNVYHGPSAEGIRPGSIKKLRVIEILYKPTTVGGATWGPPRNQVGPGKKYGSIGQHSVTPVGVGTASFDAKRILGEVDVHPDGSAMFTAPARKPLYFQLIDEDGNAAQTMRSWSTLMPQEFFSCVGCHEDKDDTPISDMDQLDAMQHQPQTIQPFYDATEPFSYAQLIQPIWNKHCIRCHAPGKTAEDFDLTASIVKDKQKTGTDVTRRKFYQSYLTLLQVGWRDDGRLDPGSPNTWVDYFTRLITTELLPPYYAGAAQSGLMSLLRQRHGDVRLTREEMDKIAAWIDLNVPFCGTYDEMNDWNTSERNKYETSVRVRQEQEAIEAEAIQNLIDGVIPPPPTDPPIDENNNRIEAEDYSNMEGIDTQATADQGGGENVGWIQNGDWTEYEFNLAEAGTYQIDLRVASDTKGGSIQLKSGGQSLGQVTVPGTGGWQDWETVSTTVTFPTAGPITLRLNFTGGGGYLFNVNWFELNRL